jgi:hypothetical protein
MISLFNGNTERPSTTTQPAAHDAPKKDSGSFEQIAEVVARILTKHRVGQNEG